MIRRDTSEAIQKQTGRFSQSTSDHSPRSVALAVMSTPDSASDMGTLPRHPEPGPLPLWYISNL